MLAREDSREFFMTIAKLLQAARVHVKYEDTLAKGHDADAKDESESTMTEEQKIKAHVDLELS